MTGVPGCYLSRFCHAGKVPTFEYLMVHIIQSTNRAEIAPLPVSERPAQIFKTSAHIWRPGVVEAEIRSLEEGGALKVFNELGLEGWKMIESTITHTRIYDYTGGGNDFFGHKTEICSPVRTQYTFIRQVLP
jgi:hypothetical protein